MNGESDLNDDIQLVRQGYARFFDGEVTDDDISDAAIVSVHHHQEITTLIGTNSKTNKIQISLSQEQIVKRMNGITPIGIKRSQSVNIPKTSFALAQNGSSRLNRGQSGDDQSQSLILRRPSLIPVKINERSASTRMYSSLVLPEKRTMRRPVEMYKSECMPPADKMKTIRKFSIPNSELHTIIDDNHRAMTSLPHIRAEAGPSSHAFNIHDRGAIPIDNKFKCGICHNTLNDPRVLDCLHTFCVQCLFDIEIVKPNTAKVNVVLASNSRENSEMDMSGSSRTYHRQIMIIISSSKISI